MLKEVKNGVYPTMVTPYTKDNKIDYNAVEQILNWYDGKIDGIFAICQSSEIFFLSFEEKLELLRFVIKNAPKGACIVASGHTADSLDTQIEEAKAYIDCGIDAYVFISNRFAAEGESSDVFMKNLDYVVKALPEISLGIYECPYPYKRLMTPAELKALGETGQFKFLKDTCCDIDEIKAKIDAFKGTDFKIFNANAATLYDSLKAGCAGYSGVMANFHPEIYYKLCHEYEKDEATAKLLSDFAGFFSVAECQQYPVNAKYYLGLEGLDMTYLSRSSDASKFSSNRQLEIRQMQSITKFFKEKMGF